MSIAVYPGSFDPVHHGHIDIARRAARLFDKVIVAVYDRPQKSLMFTTQQREAMVREALIGLPNVEVTSYSGLTVHYVEECGARVIVRGLRVTFDFEMEYQMALTNQQMAPKIDTVCLMTRLEYAFLSSSIVKDIILSGGSVDDFVPAHVAQALRQQVARCVES